MSRSVQENAPARPGTGALCAQAQADGVPCPELRDCEICHPSSLREAGPMDGAIRPQLLVPRCTHA